MARIPRSLLQTFAGVDLFEGCSRRELVAAASLGTVIDISERCAPQRSPV